MTTKIYFFDPDNQNAFSHLDIINDTAQVPANATTIAPIDADGKVLLNPTWNGTSWVGVDEETWRNSLPDVEHVTVTPSEKDTQIALLTGELLQTKQAFAHQGQQIASLTAELLAHIKTTAK